MGSYANQLFQSDSQQEGESPHTVRTEEVLIKTLVDGIVSVGVSRGEIVNTRGWKTCDRFRSQLKGQREEVVIGSWGPKVVGLKGLLAKALTRSILSELYSPPHSNSHLLCSVSVSHWRIQSEARGQGGPWWRYIDPPHRTEQGRERWRVDLQGQTTHLFNPSPALTLCAPLAAPTLNMVSEDDFKAALTLNRVAHSGV